MHFSWGEIYLARPREVGAPIQLPASYDWLGNRYEWQPSISCKGVFAIDVEKFDTPPPDLAMFGNFGRGEFLRAWTRLEATAKLMQQPILFALRSWPLIVPVMNQDEIIELEGIQLRMRSGLWMAQNLFFTCGQRLG